MPRNHISSVCAWLLAGNRISVFVRMGESKPDPPHRIRVDANRVCGLFQRIRNRVDVTSNRQSHLYGYHCERGLMTVTEDSTQSLHQKKLQQRLHKLISTTLLTSIKSIADKRGNKAAELHRAKKKQKLATRDVRDPNCAKRHKTGH